MINWLTKGSPLYFIFGREGNEAFVDDDFEVAIKVNGFKIISFRHYSVIRCRAMLTNKSEWCVLYISCSYSKIKNNNFEK